jgi:hypothetical protein
MTVAGPLCEICGKPMAESVERRCPTCAVLQDYQDYREYPCVRCGSRVRTLKTLNRSDVCGSCGIRERFAQLPEAQQQTIRAAAQQGGQIDGTFATHQVLEWPLSDVIDLVAMIRGGTA